MDNCQECAEIQETPLKKMINHYIFICPAYIQAREELIAKIGENNFYLSKIMSNTDYMEVLITFINRTGRFKSQNQPQLTHSQPHLTTPPPDI